MVGKALLDTSIVIRVMASDRVVESKLLQTHALVCPTVIGELYFGAFNSSKITANLSRVEQFIKSVDLAQTSEATARIYGEIKAALRSAANPIPENDIWIAAHAMEQQLTLITTDSHFKHVSGLLLELWA